MLDLEHCALTWLADRRSDVAAATVTLDRTTLDRILLREFSISEGVQSGSVRIDGGPGKLAELVELVDEFTLTFEVVEPRCSA